MEKIQDKIMLQLRQSPWIRRRLLYRSLLEKEFCPINELEFKKAFTFLDTDSDGFISASDLTMIAKHVNGKIPNQVEVQRWIKVFDMNYDCDISYEEFVATIIVKMEHLMTTKDIIRTFKKCDLRDEGYINAKSIRETAAMLGKHITEEEACLMIKNVDAYYKERIDLIEFNRMMQIMKKDILFCVGTILAS